MPKTIPLARHIFKRLSELNCKTIHGVPGDFFLRGLDHIQPAGLKWIGNANELCAGYAADGYARATLTGLSRRKYANAKSSSKFFSENFSSTAAVGAVMTTYGVGELSAMNAVAGAYSERVPLVHLVSTPSRKAMRAGEDLRRPVHHCLPGRGMEVYAEMTKSVTCAQAELFRYERVDEAAEKVDEVLETAVRESKPVYVAVGCDMWEQEVPVEVGESALKVKPPPSDDENIIEVADEIWGLLEEAERPLIIADALCWPFDLQNEVDELVRLTGIPAMSYASGKGVIEEERESWSSRLPNTTEYSKNADMVLVFGPLLSDTNTARWSTIPDAENAVMFNLDSIEVWRDRHKEVMIWQEMRSKDLLQALLEKARASKESWIEYGISSNGRQASTSSPRTPKSNDIIKQDDLWPKMSSYLRQDDTLLFANGTPLIGGRSMHLQPGSHVIASGIWNAIGSLLPAAQGVAAAKRDHNLPGRTIIFEGDGSLQVTVQAISDIVRYRLDVTIVIANNGGYTYERWLNGMDAEYNDVPPWRYTDAASFFGAKLDDPMYPVYATRVETWGELLEVLEDEKAADGKGLKIIDIVMDPKDVPEASKPGLLRAAESLRSG